MQPTGWQCNKDVPFLYLLPVDDSVLLDRAHCKASHVILSRLVQPGHLCCLQNHQAEELKAEELKAEQAKAEELKADDLKGEKLTVTERPTPSTTQQADVYGCTLDYQGDSTADPSLFLASHALNCKKNLLLNTIQQPEIEMQ